MVKVTVGLRDLVIAMDDYSEVDEFLDELDESAADWDFTKRIISWAEKQKKLAQAEGVDLNE